MAKTILGVDVGGDTLKLALVSGGTVKKLASVPLPLNMLKDGHITSTEAMGELLRNALRSEGIRCRKGACVLSDESVFLRTVTMPKMTEQQLSYNIPFEFNDYIVGEPGDYEFDYAMLEPQANKAPAAPDPFTEANEILETDAAPQEGMELMLAAVRKDALAEIRESLRRAGVHLVKAAPAVSACISLIRASGRDKGTETCFVDLGYKAIRVYMFRGDRHVVTRTLELGMNVLDALIAERYNVDEHRAHAYLLSNFNDCQSRHACETAYNRIAVELVRALNFYRFSENDSELSELWLLGGGTAIEPLRAIIAENIAPMAVRDAAALVPGTEGFAHPSIFMQAIGVAMQD